MKLLKAAAVVFLFILVSITCLEAQTMAFLRDDAVMVSALNALNPESVCESYDFDISPDGKFLAYVSDDRLACVDIAAKTVISFTSIPENRLHSVRWSPDGRKIAFSYFREQGQAFWQIAVVDIEDKDFRVLTENNRQGDVYAPTWDPDGKTIYGHDLNNVYAIDCANSTIATAPFSSQIASYVSSSADTLEMSADRGRVLFSGAVDEVMTGLNDVVSAVFVHEIATGETSRLTPAGICAINPRWISADEIAFEGFSAKDISVIKHQDLDDESVINRRIYRIKVDGTEMKTLVENAGRPSVAVAGKTM